MSGNETMPLAQKELTTLLRAEIEAAGSISFARFMQLALYHPAHGYYQQPSKQIGCQGDFYTSVSVGSLFGELLAFQFAGWLETLSCGAPLCDSAAGCGPARSDSCQLVEAGAHDGRL